MSEARNPRSVIGRRVECPCGSGVILDAAWDAAERLELRIRLDSDPEWQGGLHVYLARQCTIGHFSRSRQAREARNAVDQW